MLLRQTPAGRGVTLAGSRAAATVAWAILSAKRSLIST